jgi:hypothetical protein
VELFKYLSLAREQSISNFWNLLKYRQVWASKISSLNDPLEFLYHAGEKSDFATAFFKSDEHKRIGVISLSQAPDNLLMWSHYAHGHNGVCVGLVFNESESPKPRPIDYRSLIPFVNESEPDSYLFVKSSDWAYEKEYRYIIKGGADSQFILKSARISSVRIGSRVDHKVVDEIIKNCEPLKVKPLTFRKVNRNYSLEFGDAESSAQRDMRIRRTIEQLAAKRDDPTNDRSEI